MPTEPNSPDLPRYLPEIPFPSYAYVPGRAPHPASEDGHLIGRFEPEGVLIEDPGSSRDAAWLRGVDLFNHGYYWEAHEVWEGAWKACGKRGVVADFLKALIKLAACGVKVREGRLNGVKRHAATAQQLLESLAERDDEGQLLGLPLSTLIACCESAAHSKIDPDDTGSGPRRVFSFVLRPEVPPPE
jgi:hypothetical protein